MDSLLQVLGYALESERAEGAKGKTPDFVVRLLDVHPERVDGEDRELLVLLSVIDQVEVDHLLHNHVFCA